MSDSIELIPGPVDLLDPADRTHALNLGKVAWYLGLDGTAAGPRARNLIGTTAGTLVGGAAWAPADRRGDYGQVLLDGVNDYVDLGNLDSPNQAISVSAWARSTSVTGPQVVLCKNFDAGSSRLPIILCLGGSSGGAYDGVGFYSGAWNQSGLGGVDVRGDGLWHRVVGTWDGATLKYYVDGKLAASSPTGSSRSTTTTTTRIGSYENDSVYFSGGIDDVAICSRALSASEVAADYDLSRRGYPEGLNRIDLGVGLFGSAGVASSSFSVAATLAAVSLSASLTSTAPASSAVAVAPTLANVALASSFAAASPPSSAATIAATQADVTLSASFTATAPASSAITFAATLADVALTSSFTASAAGASAFSLAPTLADIVLTSSYTAAAPASSSFSASATLAVVALSSSFSANAVGASSFALAGTVPVTLAAALATTTPPGSSLAYAATLANVALSALLTSTGPGSSSMALAATLANCTASLHLACTGDFGGGVVFPRPDPSRSRGRRVGPDPSRSGGVRIGPDPSLSAGVRS